MAPKKQRAEIVREYGPFPRAERVHGVTYDGESVWFATGDRIQTMDPVSGRAGRALDAKATAGTAFDGQHLFQVADGAIQKIDAHTGAVLATIPSPAAGNSAGLTWAEGTLWVADYRARKIHRIDPNTGALLRTIECARFVTGVTFVDGELWHGTWEDDESDLRRVAPETGEVLDIVEMPKDAVVTGLESDGGDLLYCGGGTSGKIRAVRRPKRR